MNQSAHVLQELCTEYYADSFNVKNRRVFVFFNHENDVLAQLTMGPLHRLTQYLRI